MGESKQQILKTTETGTILLNEKDNLTYLITKRLLDIILSIVGIVLLLPLCIIIAIIIKIEDSKGAILFKQIRIGQNGKKFYMYKFRSMVSNAENMLEDLLDKNEASGPLFKIKEDPRITRIGKFIRKTSIDELPQLLNVLKGDMSLVGPRPALEREVKQYNSNHIQRLKVKPGLTCYWQVKGRSNLGFEEQVELDLQYINNRNLLLDIKLIFQTLFVLFGSKNAF
ncbi:exopolysaccharide biosynthesis polyprenyl glycosylphosphotransferase [Terribacillus sp. FSL K6-0262]|uniref:sugar transferase n=1 Tax=Terribacillus sp. FSL K6-0262 TaxID=2921447 RepID=UPI0030ED98DA